MWSIDDLVAIAAAALESAAADLDAEQSVYGLDARAELALHPTICDAFRDAEYMVHREQPYPGEVVAGRKRTARDRCDLVLTPAGVPLRDPVAEATTIAEAQGTLFAAAAEAEAAEGDFEGATSEEAFWLEIKTVGQYTFTTGVPGPNRAYSSELTAHLATDLAKIANEPRIMHGGLLLVLFTADEAVARHDLNIAVTRCLDRGISLRMPAAAGFAMTDRIGNAWCHVALIPTRGGLDTPGA